MKIDYKRQNEVQTTKQHTTKFNQKTTGEELINLTPKKRDKFQGITYQYKVCVKQNANQWQQSCFPCSKTESSKSMI